MVSSRWGGSRLGFVVVVNALAVLSVIVITVLASLGVVRWLEATFIYIMVYLVQNWSMKRLDNRDPSRREP